METARKERKKMVRVEGEERRPSAALTQMLGGWGKKRCTFIFADQICFRNALNCLKSSFLSLKKPNLTQASTNYKGQVGK